MTLIRTPSEYVTSYAPPKGPVLLLTCMDLRLLDEIVEFMSHDNLTNRYDQVIFAGASLGALGAPGVKRPGGKGNYLNWKKTFLDHFVAAYKLRQFTDVYILEHRDCGAYEKVFKVGGPFKDCEHKDEEKLHRKYARRLEKLIQQRAKKEGFDEIRVMKFLMDLRGHVSLLE